MVKNLFHSGESGFDGTDDSGNLSPAWANATGFDTSAFAPLDTNVGTVITTSGQAGPSGSSSAASVDLTGQTITTGASIASPFVIKPIFDSSILNAGSVLTGELEAAINTAIQSIEATIVTNETLSIDFGYGVMVFEGTSTPVTSLGESTYSINSYTYGDVRTDLTAHAAGIPALSGIAATLPTTDPTNGGTIDVADAEADALGLISGTNAGTVGAVGISSTLALGFTATGTSVTGGGYWAVGVFQHEITEVLGREQSLGVAFGTGVYTPYDFFRYSAPGTMDLTQGGTAGYFSVNDGTTDLGNFNLLASKGDLADWASLPNDAANNQEISGVVNTLSVADMTAMEVLGYTLACYATGTHILTARGNVAIEDLAVGDTVMTAFAEEAPIRWIGHRHIDCRRHPRPESVWPIRVSAGAFGDGLPRRDLFLSPDHAVAIDQMLVPIKRLVNGTSITRHPVDQVTWYHIELPDHDLLFAEGLAAESYLDTGNREAFANGGEAVAMHPDFATIAADRSREHGSCLPFATTDQEIEPFWHWLATLADDLGFPRPDTDELTGDPGLMLEAGGRMMKPIARDERSVTFLLPSGVTSAVLRSRTSTPAVTEPWRDDPRQLGVAVEQLVLRAGSAIIPLPADHPALTSGWLTAEQRDGRVWRWTNGAAVVPASLLGQHTDPLLLEVHVAGTLTYPLEAPAEPAAAVRRAA